jgi:hypothetical protein
MPDSSVREDSLCFIGEHASSLRVWAWLNVVIAHWYGKPTGAAAKTLWTLTDQLLQDVGAATKFSFVHIVANEVAMPDSQAREVLVEAARTQEARIGIAALVVNGTGFWASALRGVATSITILLPKTVQVRICGSPAELIPWFPTEHERRTGVSLDPDALVNVLTRAQIQTAA